MEQGEPMVAQPKTLSKNLMKMKFMSGGENAQVEKEKLSGVQLKETSLISNQLGRRSFGKFNQNIESLEKLHRKRRSNKNKVNGKKKKGKKVKEEDVPQSADVTDDELARA
eukprot:TRINITY_DN2735_c0_g1_i1.p2 TRINITY_DN2735_c0_g1~~TRINITY_DN2735_c0_g1_i1.p2  ORF type:complete len:111 (-),score=31.06 TRINITY_DN2735_c0_g1_i1:586-918(-)